MIVGMMRREFITLIGGAAAAWPLAARAQQPGRMRRIGVLIGLAQSDPEAKAWVAGFLQGLEKRGWSEDRNLQIDYRFALAGAQAQVLAKELVALQPDAIFAMPTPAVAALQRESHEIPIVFAALADPVGSGCGRMRAGLRSRCRAPAGGFCDHPLPTLRGDDRNVRRDAVAAHEKDRLSRQHRARRDCR